MTLDPTVANYLLNFNLTHQKAQFMLDNSKQITLKFDLQVLNVLLALQKEVLENLTADGEKLVPLLQKISRLQIPARIITHVSPYLFISTTKTLYFNHPVIGRICNTILENWRSIVRASITHDYNEAISNMDTAIRNQYTPYSIPFHYNLFRPAPPPPPPQAKASSANSRITNNLSRKIRPVLRTLLSVPRREPPTIHIEEDDIDQPSTDLSQLEQTLENLTRYDPMPPKSKIPKVDSQDSQEITNQIDEPVTEDNSKQ